MVFRGYFEKNGCSTWCFCGQNVVESLANAVSGLTLFRSPFFCKIRRNIFGEAVASPKYH